MIIIITKKLAEIKSLVGFCLDMAEFKKAKFTVWDLDGAGYIRPYPKNYLIYIQAFVFVVDAWDPERINDAKDEFQKILNESDYQDSVILVFANKQDCAKMTLKEI